MDSKADISALPNAVSNIIDIGNLDFGLNAQRDSLLSPDMNQEFLNITPLQPPSMADSHESGTPATTTTATETSNLNTGSTLLDAPPSAQPESASTSNMMYLSPEIDKFEESLFPELQQQLNLDIHPDQFNNYVTTTKQTTEQPPPDKPVELDLLPVKAEWQYMPPVNSNSSSNPPPVLTQGPILHQTPVLVSPLDTADVLPKPPPIKLAPKPTSSAQVKKPQKKCRRASSFRSRRGKESRPVPYNFLGVLPNKVLTPYNPLPFYRRSNGLNYDSFSSLNSPIAPVTYECNRKFGSNMYEPAVNKKFNEGKVPNEGNFALCPYCELSPDNIEHDCEKMFYKRNDSNYLHHMIQYHGIFSNGELVKEPEVRGWAMAPSEKSPVEVVQCPYCGEFVSLKKFKPDNEHEHRLLKYLRHVKEKHKTGKNLQVLHRQRQ